MRRFASSGTVKSLESKGLPEQKVSCKTGRTELADGNRPDFPFFWARHCRRTTAPLVLSRSASCAEDRALNGKPRIDECQT